MGKGTLCPGVMLSERVVLMLASSEAELEKGLCRQHSNSHRDTQDSMEKETPDSKCRHEEGLSNQKFHVNHRKVEGLDYCYPSPMLVHSTTA